MSHHALAILAPLLGALLLLTPLGCGEPAADLGPGESCVRTGQCGDGLACVAGRCSTDLDGIGGTVPDPDPDPATDSGAGAPDGSTADAGPPMDAGGGVDSGPVEMDAGPPDSGPPETDAGPSDLDAGSDAGSSDPDAGPDAG